MFKVQVGDRVRALISNHEYVEVEIITVILEISPQDRIVLVEWEGGFEQEPHLGLTWLVYNDPSRISYSGFGKLLEVLSRRPLMDMPYSKGPDGETGGPSGLLWL